MPNTSLAARPKLLSLWDSPRQREAYEWFAAELANLRTAFRWAAGQGNLDIAATIATYAGLLGFGVENFEPVTWAEELIEPARAASHPRLASLYVIASLCWMVGRVDDAIRYVDSGAPVLARSPNAPPYAMEAWLGAAYLQDGQPQRWAELCDAQLERRGDNHVYIRSCRVFGLAFAGLIDEAIAGAAGLIEAGAASNNPYMHTFAIAATGFPLHTTMTGDGLDVCRQGLALAQDSGNSFNESILALNLARFEAQKTVTTQALDHLTLVIRNYHDSGNVASVRTPLAILSSFLNRMERYEPAATLSGFSLSPMALAAAPELTPTIDNLREVLGHQTYDSLARRGDAMTMAAIAAYAYDQIDHVRTELEQEAVKRMETLRVGAAFPDPPFNGMPDDSRTRYRPDGGNRRKARRNSRIHHLRRRGFQRHLRRPGH